MNLESGINFVDTHCHLNFNAFDEDRDLVIRAARNAGLSRILIPGVDIESSKSAIRYAYTFPEVYAAVGIHPNDGLSWIDDSISELRKIAIDKKVVAIGEIGLDFYRNRTPRELQLKIFRHQLELAADFGLPVIIHNRDANDDILAILLDWHRSIFKSRLELANNPGVLHSFSGNQAFVSAILECKFKLGVGGPVTFRNSRNLTQLIGVISLEDLLIETDAPFLTPHPYRGERNEPANVRIVAEKISEIKETPLFEVARITTASADTLFKWR